MWEGILFSLAAMLYLCAIIAAFVQRGLRKWSVFTFAIALATDIFATVYVCIVHTGTSIWPETFHGIMGYAALLIMAMHFVWALSAVKGGRGKKYFHRGSPIAAIIWIVAFVSGMPS
jgi:hypothetical protein